MPFRQLKSFLKILIGVQYQFTSPHKDTARQVSKPCRACPLFVKHRIPVSFRSPVSLHGHRASFCPPQEVFPCIVCHGNTSFRFWALHPIRQNGDGSGHTILQKREIFMENRRIRHEATRACRLVASRNFLIGVMGILPGEKYRGRVFRPLPELKLMDSVQLPFPAGLVGFQPLHHIPAVWAKTDFLCAFLFRIEYFEQFFLPAAAVAGHKSTPSGIWYFYPTTLPAKMQRRTRFLRLRKVLFRPCRSRGLSYHLYFCSRTTEMA